MKIGILGGTFNPIHIGHLIIAEEVFYVHNLSKVLFIPVNRPPHKEVQDLVEPMHRYQMIKDAIRGLDHFEVSDLEVKREGRSFTIDTILTIKKTYGNGCELYLIIGADSLNELDTWKDVKLLSEICRFIVVNRPGYNVDDPNIPCKNLGKDALSEIKRMMVHAPPIGISSTEIRKRLKRGAGIRFWVPLAVEEYVRKYRLYT